MHIMKSRVSFGFLSLLCIICFGYVSSEDPFTIYLDGSSEFQSMKDSLKSLKTDEADTAKYIQTRFNQIEAKVDKLISVANGLADSLKNLSLQVSKSGNSSGHGCTVKLGKDRNYKL